MAEGWSSWMANALYTGGAVCASALMLLYVFQDKLLYFPTPPGASRFTKDNPPGYRSPADYSIEFEDLMIPTSDGVRIHAWLMKQPQPKARATIVFFHGNAGNIGYRLPNAVHLYRKVGCNVLLVDYRGYGHSEGEPSERGLKLDAETALNAMHARSDIDTSKIVLFGRSLGGAVAVYLAERTPTKVAGVIVENTFLSISSMVDALMPALRLVKPLVLRLDWNSERAIQTLTHPVLFVAGLEDELVPHSHMRTLFTLARKSVRPVWYAVPNGTHNDTWLRGGDAYFDTLRSFLNDLGGQTCASDGANSAPVAEGGIPTMPLASTLRSLQSKPKDE